MDGGTLVSRVGGLPATVGVLLRVEAFLPREEKKPLLPPINGRGTGRREVEWGMVVALGGGARWCPAKEGYGKLTGATTGPASVRRPVRSVATEVSARRGNVTSDNIDECEVCLG